MFCVHQAIEVSAWRNEAGQSSMKSLWPVVPDPLLSPAGLKLRMKAGEHENGIRYFEGGVAEGGADLL